MTADLPQAEHQGENPIPRLQSDALLEEIRKWKRKIDEGSEESSVTEKNSASVAAG
jgi:hypothetical protein